tara:strand:- start:790 stop:975 length:186 start_codon:yes stop_codon:yes gene_type:complete
MTERKAILGDSFEELTSEEMMDVDGGTGEVTTVLSAASTLPCSIGASISLISVGVTWIVTH